MRYFYVIVMLLSCNLFLSSCDKKKDIEPILDVSLSQVNFIPAGGDTTFEVNCNDSWSVSYSAQWLQLSRLSGVNGKTTISLSANENQLGVSRTVVLVISSGNGQSRRISVTQTPLIYPSYNTSPIAPNEAGMLTAIDLSSKIKLGVNIGNTLEAPNGENGWGNPNITEDYIKFLKRSGFNAVRLPCAWDWGHLDNKKTAHIDPVWMSRVKEVVGYCVNNDMYVLLNIHYDGGWLEKNCTKAKQDSVNAKQKAFWEQIATTMRDFDSHLMFGSANEPDAKDAEGMSVLISYHQTFIKAVRSTGGRNTYRTLVLQGNSDSPLLNATNFPKDPTPNRLMFEPHNYTPSQFTFLDKDVSWGKMAYYWGAANHSTIEPERNATYGEEDDQIKWFKMLKEQYIDKGIPVLMGEYGAYRRTTPKDMEKHNASVDYWLTFVTHQAVINGVKPFFWETGGILDRNKNIVIDQRSVDAIMAGGKI